jgi:hypothetical protein
MRVSACVYACIGDENETEESSANPEPAFSCCRIARRICRSAGRRAKSAARSTSTATPGWNGSAAVPRVGPARAASTRTTATRSWTRPVSTSSVSR